MKNIEVELRSIISEEQYHELLDFLKKNAEFVNEDNQETHYFDAKDDLRIQKNDFFSKIVLKKGKLHDDMREETEVKCGKDDFDSLKRLFADLGFQIAVKWFRKRHSFRWEGVDVTVDNTKGFGYILEMEKITDDDNKNEALELLKNKASLLGIKVASKEELQRKFQHYRENWKELIK